MSSAYYKSRIPETAKKVFEGIAIDVYHWPQKLYTGKVTAFEIAKRLDAVNVIAIKDGKIVMLRQEQPLREAYWSVPGGHIDRGEDSSRAAARELLEETGMTFKTLKLVEVKFIGNNRLEWYVYRYIASDFDSVVAATPGAGERIEVFELSLAEAQEKARDNIYAAPSIIMAASSLEDILALPEVPSF